MNLEDAQFILQMRKDLNDVIEVLNNSAQTTETVETQNDSPEIKDIKQKQ